MSHGSTSTSSHNLDNEHDGLGEPMPKNAYDIFTVKYGNMTSRSCKLSDRPN